MPNVQKEGSSRTTSVSQSSVADTEEVASSLADVNLTEKDIHSPVSAHTEHITHIDIDRTHKVAANITDAGNDHTGKEETNAPDCKEDTENTKENAIGKSEICIERKEFGEGDILPIDCLEEEESEEDDDEGDDDDDADEDGWITPSNIKELKKAMGDVNCEKANVTVGCLTHDFAMQVGTLSQ